MATQSNRQLFYITAACLLVLTGYMLFLLTLGSFDVYAVYSLSLLFWDMWENLIRLSVAVDSDLVGLEGFDVNGITTAYFLPFPSFIRGLWSLVGYGQSAVLSVALGGGIFFLGSLLMWRLVYQNITQCKPHAHPRLFVIGILFATALSPMVGMMSYPTVFWEAIIWAATLFLIACLFSMHCLSAPGAYRKFLLIFTLVCSLCLFTRATFSLVVCLLFALTIVSVVYLECQHKTPWVHMLRNRMIWLCIITFALALSLLLLLNYAKWANPFEFYPLQYYKMWSEEQKLRYFSHAGALDWSRLPTTFAYYFLPTAENWSWKAPFIQMASSHSLPNIEAFDYFEPRLALTLTQPIAVALSTLGIVVLFFLMLRHALASYLYILPAALTSLIPIFFILSIHSLSIRYTGDFIPALMIFSFVGLAGIVRATKAYVPRNTVISAKTVHFSKRFFWLVVIIFSMGALYLSTSNVLLQNVLWNTSFRTFNLIPLKTNETVFFKLRGDSDKGSGYLYTGWSDALEEFGSWSNHPKPSLLILPEKQLTAENYFVIKAHAFITPNWPQQQIKIWINGRYHQTVELKQASDNLITIRDLQPSLTGFSIVRIGTQVFNTLTSAYGSFEPKPLWIEFEISHPARPKDYGIGEDQRLLGLGLVSLTLY